MSIAPPTAKVDVNIFQTTSSPPIKLYIAILGGSTTLFHVEDLLFSIADYQPTIRLIIMSATSILYLLLAFALRITRTVDVDSNSHTHDLFLFLFFGSLMSLVTLIDLVIKHSIAPSNPMTEGLLFPVMLLFYGLLFTWCAGVGWRFFLHRLFFWYAKVYIVLGFHYKEFMSQFNIVSEPRPPELAISDRHAAVQLSRIPIVTVLYEV